MIFDMFEIIYADIPAVFWDIRYDLFIMLFRRFSLFVTFYIVILCIINLVIS